MNFILLLGLVQSSNLRQHGGIRRVKESGQLGRVSSRPKRQSSWWGDQQGRLFGLLVVDIGIEGEG